MDKLKLLILILLPVLYTNVVGIDDRDMSPEDLQSMDKQEYNKYVKDNNLGNTIQPACLNSSERIKPQELGAIDSDNDGLANQEERYLGTSISNEDTDGDGLNDTEEKWWACIPNDKDTDNDGYLDGDEIHLEVGDPNKGDGCPYTEKSLGDTDHDRDGLPAGAEGYVLNTRSNNPSTDGDRYSDGMEVLGFDFYGIEVMPDYVVHNPLGPATADIIIEMDPNVKLNLAKRVKEESNILKSFEKAFNDQKGFNEAATLNYKIGTSSSIESSMGSPSATNPLGVETTAKVEAHASIDLELQAGSSASQTWTSESSELHETLKTEEVDLSGSTLQVYVHVKNIGDDIALEGVNELLLNLYMGGDKKPFYTYNSEEFGKILKPGDGFDITIKDIPIDYELFKRLVAGEGVRVGIAHYSFGEDQKLLYNARAACVEVNLDDGTGLIKRRIAPSSSSGNIKLSEALQRLNIPYECYRNGTLKSVNGKEIKYGCPPYKWWTFTIIKQVKQAKSPEIDKRNYPGDLLNASVYKGDLVLLKYQLDSDGDMLSDREERLINTQADMPDTDKDGLWDGDSIPGRNVTGEKAFGTNPLLSDTDGDGQNDSVDSDPLDNPYVIESKAPEPVVVYDQENYTGTRMELWEDTPNLGSLNNKIQSLKVPWGCHVVLYKNANYDAGNGLKLFVKDTPWVGEDFHDAASSIEIKRIVLFDHKDFKGDSKTVLEPNVSYIGQEFDNKAESLIVPQGYKVTLYKDKDFKGQQRTCLGNQTYIGAELRNKVSSIRVTESLKSGDIISLQATNGKYLSCMGHKDKFDTIESSKDAIDLYCMFTVTVYPENQISLRAYNGKYLARTGIEFPNILKPSVIEAAINPANKIDRFTITFLPDNKIALQADDGTYLSRMGHNEPISKKYYEKIEAAKSSIDEYCIFTLIKHNAGK